MSYVGQICVFLFKKKTNSRVLVVQSDTVPFNIKWEIEAKDGGCFSFILHPNRKLVGSEFRFCRQCLQNSIIADSDDADQRFRIDGDHDSE